MTNETVGFAFVTGLLIGFILSVIFIAKLMAANEKTRIKNGLMESNGVVYRITRVEP